MENSIIQKTDNWLRDPKRLYVVGLAIFNLCASVPMKKGYGAYLNDFDEEVKPFDARFNLLINKVSAIHQNMKVAPQKYLEIDSQESIVSKQVRAIVSIKAEQDKVYQDIAAINGKVEKVAVLNTALSGRRYR